MAKIRAVRTETKEKPLAGETVLHYEIRTGGDFQTGKKLSRAEKMRATRLLLDPTDQAIRDVVDFADGLALILSCSNGSECNEEWGQFATMAAAPLRTIVIEAKKRINEMTTAHSVLGDMLKSLEE